MTKKLHIYTDIVHSLRIILIQQLLICVVFSVFWKCLLIDTTNTQYIYYEIYFLSTLWWYQQFWKNNPWTISNIFVLCFLPFLFIFFRTSRETNKKVSKLILHTIICGILLCYVKRLCVYENENFFQEFDQSTKRLHVYAGIFFAPQDRHL